MPKSATKIGRLRQNYGIERRSIQVALSPSSLAGVDSRLAAMQAKMDAITGVYDDLHEKMHEIDKTRR